MIHLLKTAAGERKDARITSSQYPVQFAALTLPGENAGFGALACKQVSWSSVCRKSLRIIHSGYFDVGLSAFPAEFDSHG